MSHRILDLADWVIGACVLAFCALAIASAAEPLKLTLPEAVRMALAQNHSLNIARLKVVEYEQKKAENRSSYFPDLKNQSTAAYTTAQGIIDIPAGAFGAFQGAGLVPNRDILINQGNPTFVTSGTSLTQPITPLIRIHQANRIARSEVAATRDELKKAENEVALKVHQVYYGILIARLEKQAAEQQGAYSKTLLDESQQEAHDGSALKSDVIQSRAALLQSEQALLSVDLQISDLKAELNDLLGLPIDTTVMLSPLEPASFPDMSRDESLGMAMNENPQIAAATESVEQAKAALKAAKSAYIPDISLFARHSYQNGVPFLVHNFGTFGAQLNYDIFDFGKRRAIVRQREAQLAQAQENVERLKESVSVEIQQSLNKVERTKQMVEVASEVVKLRTEGERIAENQVTQGAILVSARRQASAASYKAQAEMLQAQLNHLLAQAELEQTIGRTPGQ